MKTFLSFCFLFSLSFQFTAVAYSKDITEFVRTETDLAKRIQKICREHCLGNRREGNLTRMDITKHGNNSYKVIANAYLRNRHHQDAPIGGSIEIYSYTIDIEALGTLDDNTCNLRIDSIHVTNDKTGVLNNLAQHEEGKIHKIENCARFTSGF